MTTLLPRGTEDTPRARPVPRAGSRLPARPAAAPPPAGAAAPSAEAAVPMGRPRLPFAALILLLLAGGLCALLALNTASAAGEVRERDLADRVRTLTDTEQDLRRQVAALEAPSALAAAAAGLGMVPGEHPAFLVIGADGSVSVLGDPQAAPLPAPPAAPTPDPTAAPTPEPTAAPTPEPTAAPTPEPTAAPTPEPVVTSDVPSSPPAGQ